MTETKERIGTAVKEMKSLREKDEASSKPFEGAEPQPMRDAVVINEIQLLLAEKRTSLAFLRTGIAVIALPLSLVSFLIATSEHYRLIRVWPLLTPLLLACLVLVAFGVYLIRSAVVKIRHADHILQKLKENNALIAQFIQ